MSHLSVSQTERSQVEVKEGHRASCCVLHPRYRRLGRFCPLACRGGFARVFRISRWQFATCFWTFLPLGFCFLGPLWLPSACRSRSRLQIRIMRTPSLRDCISRHFSGGYPPPVVRSRCVGSED